ncbi:MAG: beta-lactamase family protein [Gemmatimonadetes bacterium]|nr:beta-lactamase family protein [Gemmatimonadota bacterium]
MRLTLSLSLALAAAVLPTPSRAQDRPAGWPAFAKQMDSLARAGHVVGGSAVFVKDGHIVARHHYGLADRTRNAPVTDRSIFHYGSITKTLTAIAILQLRDRGKLSLDDKVIRWVPELRRMHDPFGMMDSITVRMLLAHTSGFQNPTWPYGNGKPWEPFEPTTWDQLVAMMPYQQLVFRPGSRWGYSNPAYIYLARIIESISGDPWVGYIQKQIFSPLQLDRSYFGSTPYHLADDRANNYTIVRDSATKSTAVRENGRDFDPGITIPNGGWNAPLDDLARYVAFLTNSSGGDTERQRRFDAVLSRATLTEMWQPIIRQGAAPESRMGLGFFLLDHAGTPLIGHTGSQAGFLSFFWVNPQTRTGVVVALNTDSNVRDVPAALTPIMQRALPLLRGTP